MSEEMTFPKLLSISGGERVFHVLDEIRDGVVFRDGKGYVRDNFVWIYSKNPPTDSRYPYFWHEHGKICFGKIRDSIRDEFSAERAKSQALMDTVFKVDPNEQLYDEEAISDMNAATSIYVPFIKPEDDVLKKIIKHVIIFKRININRLKSKMDKPYMLSNMKTALTNDTKMSVPNFILWANLLGMRFTIIAEDDGNDVVNPLKKRIVYDSFTDQYTIEDAD